MILYSLTTTFEDHTHFEPQVWANYKATFHIPGNQIYYERRNEVRKWCSGNFQGRWETDSYALGSGYIYLYIETDADAILTRLRWP